MPSQLSISHFTHAYDLLRVLVLIAYVGLLANLFVCLDDIMFVIPILFPLSTNLSVYLLIIIAGKFKKWQLSQKTSSSIFFLFGITGSPLMNLST